MKAGYNSSKIIGPWEKIFNSEYVIEPISYQGACFGGYFEIPLSPKIYLQPEMMIAMKGVKLNDTISGYVSVSNNLVGYKGAIFWKHQSYYFQIPLALKYKLTNHINLLGGICYSQLLGVKIEGYTTLNYSQVLYNSWGPYTTTSTYFYKDDLRGLNETDIGFITGLELNLRKVGLYLRYERGLSNIFDDDTEGNIDDVFVNATLQAGLSFRLKRIND